MRFFFVILALVSLATLLAIPIAGAAVTAPPPVSNETATETSTPAPESTLSIPLNEVVTVTEWEHKNGSFYVTVESDLYTELVVSDSMALVRSIDGGSESGGSVEVPKRSYTLDEGTQTIIFDSSSYKGESAITLNVEGGSYVLYTGATDSRLIPGPISMPMLQAGILGASISTALVILLKTYRYGAGKESDPERVA